MPGSAAAPCSGPGGAGGVRVAVLRDGAAAGRGEGVKQRLAGGWGGGRGADDFSGCFFLLVEL